MKKIIKFQHAHGVRPTVRRSGALAKAHMSMVIASPPAVSANGSWSSTSKELLRQLGHRQQHQPARPRQHGQGAGHRSRQGRCRSCRGQRRCGCHGRSVSRIAIVHFVNYKEHTVPRRHARRRDALRHAGKEIRMGGPSRSSAASAVSQSVYDDFLNTKLLYRKDGGTMFYHMVQKSFPKARRSIPGRPTKPRGGWRNTSTAAGAGLHPRRPSTSTPLRHQLRQL